MNTHTQPLVSFRAFVVWIGLTACCTALLLWLGVAWWLGLPTAAFCASLARVLWLPHQDALRALLASAAQQAVADVVLMCCSCLRLLASVTHRIAVRIMEKRSLCVLALLVSAQFVLMPSGRCAVAVEVLKGAGRLMLRADSKALVELAGHSPSVAGRLIRELGEEGAERFLVGLSPQARAQLARHGDGAVDLLRECGEASVPLLSRHGEALLKVHTAVRSDTLTWVTRYGEEGLQVAGRFGVTATERLAASAGPESFAVVLRAGRPAAAILGRHPEALPLFKRAIAEGSERQLIDTIERGGASFFSFAAKNWKGMTVTALCAAFVTQPRSFTEPSAEVVKGLGQRALELIGRPQGASGLVMALLLVGIPTIALVVFLRPMFRWFYRMQKRLFAGSTESKSAPRGFGRASNQTIDLD